MVKDAVPRDLAVVLHDLAWLLPRTIGLEAMQAEPQPPTALEVMRLLTRRPGLSVNDVSRETGVAANNVSSAVTQLERQGLVERRRDASDGRVTRLHPTRRALEARQAREHSWGESMNCALGHLHDDERKALLAAVPALQQLSRHLASADPRA